MAVLSEPRLCKCIGPLVTINAAGATKIGRLCRMWLMDTQMQEFNWKLFGMILTVRALPRF